MPPSDELRIGILGPGRLGSALARGLSQSGIAVHAIAGGDAGHGQRLATELGAVHCTAAELPAQVGVIFATVPDGQLRRATGPLAVEASHAVVHCSGAAGLDALAGPAARGAAVGCLHPLQSFPTRELGRSQFAGVTIGLEASSPDATALLQRLTAALGAHALSLAGVDRAGYHAAAVLASNAVIALHHAAEEAWCLAGLPAARARPALSTLTLGAARAVQALPLAAALTGPVARGDVSTVRAHLRSLSPRHALSALYRALSLRMLAAGGPNAEERRAQLQQLLGGPPEPTAGQVRAQDTHFMRLALAEAAAAAEAGDVPVGCVLVRDGEVIATGGNQREADRDPLGHAELAALRRAARALGDWRLSDVTVYVTLEPCPMCAGALVHSRVARVVYGCDDPKAGGLRSLYQLGSDPRLNHRFEVTAGVLGSECAAQLTRFFVGLRQPETGAE